MLTKKITDRFSRAVSTYDQYSYPQQMIGERLIELIIPSQSRFHTVMDLGCGTGLTTLKLAQRLNIGKGVASDISVPLLNMAKEKLTQSSFQTKQFNFDCWYEETSPVDLIFSNMALHWSQDFEKLLCNIHQSLKSDGVLAFSLPIYGTFNELSEKHRNAFITLNDANQYLIQAGFKLQSSNEEIFTFRFKTWLKALRSIKATGATYLIHNTHFYLTKSEIYKRVLANQAAQPTLTYQVGFFIAKKGR